MSEKPAADEGDELKAHMDGTGFDRHGNLEAAVTICAHSHSLVLRSLVHWLTRGAACVPEEQ